MSDVTRILVQIESGNPSAAAELLPLVYDELRKLASVRLAQEKPGHTLQATALVHEAYLRLVKETELRRIAETERDRSGRLLYGANMNLAKVAWDEAMVSRVVELLDQHRPQPGQPYLRNFEWFYLDRLCHSELLTLRGHTNWIWSVAFSSDGKRLVSASYDQTVKVWDATPRSQESTP